MKRIRGKLKGNRGEGYIDMALMTLVTVLAMVFIINVLPAFFTKLTLDTYANELVREAEIAGRVGTETTARLARINELKGLNPNISWSKNGNIQIGQEVTVTATTTVDIGFFTFGSFPVNLVSKATGVSEVLWK